MASFWAVPAIPTAKASENYNPSHRRSGVPQAFRPLEISSQQSDSHNLPLALVDRFYIKDNILQIGIG